LTEHGKISGGVIISFLLSLALCFFIIVGIVVFRTCCYQAWYNCSAVVALIIAGLLICFLFPLAIHNSANLKQMGTYFDNMSIHDTLTQVYNRRYVDENIDRLIKAVSRSNGVITVMAFELDYFKDFNDFYGHKVGDACLQTVANVISHSVKRDNDVVARYGGNKFIVVLPNTDENGAHKVADRLLKNVKDCNLLHEKNDAAACVTISIGVTIGGSDYTQLGDDYIGKATEALRLSVQNGCDRYTFLQL
jgi:diguanylate cyclase (GGDEF)-like protein